MRKGRKIGFVLLLVGRVSVSIIVVKYNIFPRADKGCLLKKFWWSCLFKAISEHYHDFKHTYVYWIWLRGSASYVINKYTTLMEETLESLTRMVCINDMLIKINVLFSQFSLEDTCISFWFDAFITIKIVLVNKTVQVWNQISLRTGV